MRYDIFYCYFQKVAKAQKDSTVEVEYRESQKHFNFKEIDGDIQTLENSFIETAPTKSKHLLLACSSFVAACVYSWQVTLVILLGMLLIVIFNFFVDVYGVINQAFQLTSVSSITAFKIIQLVLFNNHG